MQTEDLPLHGLLVLDLSQGIAGPHCGLLLRQQGARVIKIEPPEGDWSRQMGRARDGQTAISIAYNVGKESVVLDIRTPVGKTALLALARKADVVVQNYRPGVVERMGVGYDELAAQLPGLVYVSISGHGATGPDARLPALDTTMQAASGLMHANRDAAGLPRRIGIFLVDLCTGLYAAQNTMAALLQAARSGRGRHVRVSMLETAAALQSYLVLDDALFPQGESGAFNVPTGLFEASDGRIYISMLNDAMFERLSTALGFDDWLADPTLRTSAGRIQRAQELNGRLGRAVAQHTVAHWESLLLARDVLFARVNRPGDLRHAPQAMHAGIFGVLPQAGLGDLPWPNVPGAAGVGPLGTAPLLGEHTAAVLAEFGLA